MPANPNKLSQFWQELKRRKVVRVITVYAAAAFVLLELTDIVAPSLGLPGWTLNFVIILLCVGFIITVIVSWIYDIHPEGGIIKTEPTIKVSEESVHTSSKGWRIASYISFVVIVALIILNTIPRTGKKEILEKSIAVLPFINDSPDEENEYFINGIMDEMLIKLQVIKDFRVPGRTSVEQYRNPSQSIPEIAAELGVNYIVEGSGQKYGNTFVLRVQLLDGHTGMHLWGESIEQKIESVDAIISIQSGIAESIATELKAVITPEVKQRIEEIPTNNLNAYDYYLLGRHNLNYNTKDEDLWKAIEYFQQAVAIDTSFALAYSGLADVYYQLITYAILSPVEAYPKIREYAQRALQLNEEISYSHRMLGIVKQSFEYDYAGAEKEYIRALDIDPKGAENHMYYATLLWMLGRIEEATIHTDLTSELDPNLFSVQLWKSLVPFATGSKEEGFKLLENLRNSYPDNPVAYWMSAVTYTQHGRYNEALSILETQLTLMGNDNISDEIGLLGYLYGRMDQKDKAKKQLTRLDELSSTGYYVSPRTRVWIYLGLDNLDEAFAILEEAVNDHSIDPESMMIYFYPIESLQSEPRFYDLLKRIGLTN